MRKPVLAGNWKMNKTYDEALDFIYSVNENLPSHEVVESIIFPPAMLLVSLVKRQGANLEVGAQNMYFTDNGAYTGEISADMLKAIGVEFVIVGHSERRAYFNESDEMVNLKAIKAIKKGLTPIVCVGETEEQFKKDNPDNILKRQVYAALIGVPEDKIVDVIIAYEPIWAIGTGNTATPKIANAKCNVIRNAIKELYGDETAEKIRILYGGSVKPDNTRDLISEEDVDGVLVGGASLDANQFVEMAKIIEEVVKNN